MARDALHSETTQLAAHEGSGGMVRVVDCPWPTRITATEITRSARITMVERSHRNCRFPGQSMGRQVGDIYIQEEG